ncbi:MAG TPA: sigma-54-dependent Fis family transcriptional regulator [Polyangiaceae bacterium]|nr:sigma-54-dependent Fis family transcriptional regulator [Polyangiaceae bacterium]
MQNGGMDPDHPLPLDPRSLLDFDPEHAQLLCAGQRSVMVGAAALGSLRKELLEAFGVRVARRVLTRFAYAHGHGLAERLREALPDLPRPELGVLGSRLAGLQGHLLLRLGRGRPGDGPAEVVWAYSWEADEHVRQVGQVDYCACWTLSGFASGFLSALHGEAVYSVEHECVAKGDPICRARTGRAATWGAGLDEHLPYFHGEGLGDSLDEVVAALKRAEGRLRARARALAAAGAEAGEAAGVVSRSPAMRRALDLTRRAARADATVLFSGRSGVGKERLARLLHGWSPRAGGPFVALNCGALPEYLVESELFGHARGAFTGAIHDRAGLFEAASGGTLFLDEVGELSPAVQVKLLRALQEREVRRVGENKTRRVDVRIVAATHRDLGRDAAEGRFREDLYFRLRVVEVRVPSLAERPEDVLPLARVLLAEAALRLGRPPPPLGPAAADLLTRHAWPGNVRELENALERAVALAAGPRVEPEDLPEELRRGPAPAGPAPRPPAPRTLADVEREHVLATLAAHGGNQTLAARALGIGTTTLYRKLKRYRADDESAAAPPGAPPARAPWP